MTDERVPLEDLPGVAGGLDLGYHDRLTVLDAFLRNPRLGWTPEGLSVWYGIRVDLVRRLLVDLQARRIIRRVRGRKELYLLRRPARAARRKELYLLRRPARAARRTDRTRRLVASGAVGPAGPGPSAGVPSPPAKEPFANEP